MNFKLQHKHLEARIKYVSNNIIKISVFFARETSLKFVRNFRLIIE